ncbi:SEC-C metal-binding domain-containing protein [Vibrio genomosp. F6]|uniref:Prepilin peptidase n=1 Tax=Vibrio genomosp. F6 str. FF-238 TaxID=1191298 RepID=A0A1E5D156_9VIBR|nr:SEC-C metal-binding domain-containing protein [Vibrio genomosp. F6]OEE77087.1 prepilin peptidase [Vibrio genomosp. F6 str. FF-238]
MYQLLTLPDTDFPLSSVYLEGAIFASNLATKPLDPEVWLQPLLGEELNTVKAVVVEQINKQHNLLQRSEFELTQLLSEGDFSDNLADFAEGFMNVWPVIETQWEEANIGEGSMRMLQAFLTTLMLAIDEEQTQQQMKEAGFDQVPALADFTDQLDVIVVEVALAADEAMLGNKSQIVNPFKGIGRNDPCPCNSRKKFKQCCSNK